MAGSIRNGPLGVDALLQKQKDAASFKPKFLSKAEREKQALAKKEAETQETRQRETQERRQRDEFERKARHAAESHGRGGGGGDRNYAHRPDDLRRGRGGPDRNGYGERYHPYAQDQREARDRYDHDRRTPYQNGGGGARHSGGRVGPPAPHVSSSSSVSERHPSGLNGSSIDADSSVPLTEAERELIRNKYLGIQERSKKKTRKQLQDKKLMFGWDQTEDTSDTLNPELFDRHIEANVFGAGGRAGMDVAQRQQSAITASSGDPLRRGAKSAFAEKPWTEKSLEEMRERDWRIFREDFGISTKGGTIPRPLRSWRESDIPDDILRIVDGVGYIEPTPIQRQAIPIGLQNRDLIGIAETGSGKTASFVIPMLAYISKLPRLSDENRHLGPYALIIAPTRELAQQIEVETKKFTDQLGFKCVSIVGGRDMQEQSFSLRDGAEIIVATPGRLKDCIERHILVLGQCMYLVLDEADKSIGLGFADQLDYILDSMPASNLKPDTEESEDPLATLQTEGVPRYRVTMLYSATMPPSVERLAKNYLRRPATITIGDANQAVGTVEQRVEFISGDDKKKTRLLQILSSGLEPPMIVFSTTISSVDALAHDLRRSNFNVTTLHSKKTQSQREEALASLRSGQADILVATDLAGRGLDVPDVSAVINFSFPTTFEAYIHRIGRTGRAGKEGIAFTFLDGSDDEYKLMPNWFRQKFWPRHKQQQNTI